MLENTLCRSYSSQQAAMCLVQVLGLPVLGEMRIFSIRRTELVFTTLAPLISFCYHKAKLLEILHARSLQKVIFSKANEALDDTGSNVDWQYLSLTTPILPMGNWHPAPWVFGKVSVFSLQPLQCEWMDRFREIFTPRTKTSTVIILALIKGSKAICLLSSCLA